MHYTRVDLDAWDRGKPFQFYMDKMRIVMSLCFPILYGFSLGG